MFLFIGISVMLLPYSFSSGALGSPDLLSSYSRIALASHITTILIITHLSNSNHTLNHLSTDKSI